MIEKVNQESMSGRLRTEKSSADFVPLASELCADADLDEVQYWIERLRVGHCLGRNSPSRVLASPGAPWEIG